MSERVGEDHLVAFLDRLAADLDGSPASLAGLAAQAHLSRFHFDRVVSALAGESPVRLRSRVLMERAAYRMVVTDHTLLDIAVEAGFSSHAAFTRAFTRAYDVTPAQWRRRPRSFRVAADNDVHFHPPGGLRLPARHKMGSVDLVVEMVEHHAWLVGELVERAGRLEDADLDAPITNRVDGVDGESLRRLLSRLVGQMAMWNAAVDERSYDFGIEDREPVASMLARVRHEAPTFVVTVRRFAEEGRFDETFVEAFSATPVVLSHGAMVAHVLTFAAHQRLVAIDRLHACGIDDLGLGDPKQWFGTMSRGRGPQ